ncbi:MAG: peptidylprolyl isomerase [Eubacteriales bacterium]|nr:peptidylprolyl isomerase [Eubacteriales bacterium]
MKRKLIAMLCVTAMSASLLAGCGSDSGDTDTTNTENTADTEDTTDTEDTDTEQEDEGQTAVDDAETDEAVGEEEAEAAGFSDGTELEEDGEAGTDDETSDTEDSQEDETSETVLNTDEPLTGKHHVEIVIKDYGTIEAELDADAAPISVTNFVKLAQEDFYDGLTFHRIMDGFMMQGGDPLGNGTGGSEETIKGEFSSNGVENDLSHTRGAISMARSSQPDSASSQFFIVQSDSTFLDGDYAAFGYVTEGMDIVDEICKEAEPTDDNGTIPSEEQPVIETVKVID